MNGLKIRECVESDQEAVRDLIVGVIFEYFKHGPINKNDYHDFCDFYRNSEGIFYVAEFEGEIIGSIAIKKDSECVAHLRRMYLKKSFRRKGIGKKLYDRAVEFCKGKDYSKIVLFTYPEMKEAISFYKKEGFVETRREGDAIFFEKSL